MKRKPPAVSIVIFIILFIILYFVEQRLHIFTNAVNTSAVLDSNVNSLGALSTSFVSSISSVF